VTHLVKGHANAQQGFVERAEFDALLPWLPSQVLRDVVAFAYCSGMRKGEILSLTWDGYDHEAKAITLRADKAKTGRGRVIRWGKNPELVAVMERRLAARRLDSPLIFHNGRGRHVGNFSTSWGRALPQRESVLRLPRPAAHGHPQYGPSGRPRARSDGDLGSPDAGDL
jgi:integrase